MLKKELSNTMKTRSRGAGIILSAVLYGCEAFALILREKHKQSVFGNRAKQNIWS
jgi:hypothetical protein